MPVTQRMGGRNGQIPGGGKSFILDKTTSDRLRKRPHLKNQVKKQIEKFH